MEVLHSEQMDDALRARVSANVREHERHHHPTEGLRHAAVALVLMADPEERPSFVLTRRASKLRDHPGQWAFPGGRLDEGEDVDQAALRELHEEVGLELGSDTILGHLDDYPTRSGFVITPVVLWAGAHQPMTPNPAEVARIYHVPLRDLADPRIPQLRDIPESPRPVISVPILDTDIHAPTAAIMYQLREVALRGLATRVHHYEQPTWAWK